MHCNSEPWTVFFCFLYSRFCAGQADSPASATDSQHCSCRFENEFCRESCGLPAGPTCESLLFDDPLFWFCGDGCRIGTFLGYFLYKNIAFSMTLFWFCLLNGFSGQALFDSSYQVTPLPIPRSRSRRCCCRRRTDETRAVGGPRHYVLALRRDCGVGSRPVDD
jgi:hypothetical protein